jgi:hypothetical protein
MSALSTQRFHIVISEGCSLDIENTEVEILLTAFVVAHAEAALFSAASREQLSLCPTRKRGCTL